ncbi:hypothetical protein [Natronorubrum sp. FCH18a]|uniref:hypothetical protein n=1 Tax=Natronorubrum sp. FCH18a TaxID=3447018 RepID=UPI003F5187F5
MRTFDLLIIQGRPVADVVTQIAEEFEASEAAVKTDIDRLESWVDDLPPRTDPSGKARMQEFRDARRRLYELIPAARRKDDPDLERKVIRDIITSIRTDIRLCQSLGLAVDESDVGVIELPESITGDDPLVGLAERDPAIESTSPSR